MTMEERLSKFEIAIAAVSGVILFVATLAGPGLDPGLSRGRLAITHARQSRRLAGLETALKTAREHSSALQSQLTQAGLVAEQARSELTALMQERDTLSTQVATCTGQIQELEKKLQSADEEAAKFRELLSLHEISKERDAAVAKAQEAEERIRALTLELHRSGVWP